jgi:hypothetical protein
LLQVLRISVFIGWKPFTKNALSRRLGIQLSWVTKVFEVIFGTWNLRLAYRIVLMLMSMRPKVGLWQH